MSIRYNLSALKDILSEVIDPLFITDLDIVNFKRRFKELYIKIK
jgi:hypothetical protein